MAVAPGAPCARPAAPSVRHRQGALIVKDLADPLLLLGRQRAPVGRELGADGEAALHGRPRADRLEPALEMLELIDLLPLRLPVDGPGIGDDVGDRVAVAGEVWPVPQPCIEHAIEPVGFVREAADGVRLVAFAIAEPPEMSGLAEL